MAGVMVFILEILHCGTRLIFGFDIAGKGKETAHLFRHLSLALMIQYIISVVHPLY